MNTNPVVNASTIAAEHLNLTPEQHKQQVDLCIRLVHMVTHGVPTVCGVEPQANTELALHALITAYMALSVAQPRLTEVAARLALSVSHELTVTHELRAIKGSTPETAH